MRQFLWNADIGGSDDKDIHEECNLEWRLDGARRNDDDFDRVGDAGAGGRKTGSDHIGIKAEHKFAGCRVADDAVQVAKLHVAQGYATAVTQFSRLSEEDHCAVLDGVWFPHRVVWHGDLQESTLKVVEMSPVGPDGNANFTLKFYVLTEREVVGSGIKEKVAGIES